MTSSGCLDNPGIGADDRIYSTMALKESEPSGVGMQPRQHGGVDDDLLPGSRNPLREPGERVESDIG